MIKSILFLSVFFVAAQHLSAQCPVNLNCPSAAVQVCDETNNDPKVWDASDWWDAAVSSHDLSDASVDLSIMATDDCSNGDFNFQYLLFLDLDGDGIQETVVNSSNPPASGTVRFNNVNTPNYTGGTSRVFDQRNVPPIFKYRFSMETLIKGGQAGIARLRWQQGFGKYVLPQLPYGTHRIKWKVINSVGNQAECEYTFTVKDCKAPDVVCIDGLSANIMPTGLLTVWASDLLQYATDNYAPAAKLKCAISKADVAAFPADALGNPIVSLLLGCDDMGEVALKIWAQDLAGNAGFCETILLMQDNYSNCNGNPGLAICAETVCGTGVLEDAQFEASGTPPPGLPPIDIFATSDGQGCAGINAIPPAYADNYVITSSKGDNPLNGVSSYDLLLISWHIDGTQPFTEPWQWVAADADNNGVIDSADIVELWKLNLGIYVELPNNASWRFFRSDYIFPPGNPLQFPIPDSFTVAELIADPTLHFLGVKIGDVNCTAINNGFNQNPTERAFQKSAAISVLMPQPNPTTTGTSIPIQLPALENVQVEISDLSGRLLWLNSFTLESGAHLLQIPASAFPQAGVYVWRVTAGEAIQAGKIIRL